MVITGQGTIEYVFERVMILVNFSPSDVPSYRFASSQQAWRLPNGDTVINNRANEWSKSVEDGPGTIQIIEVTPAKEVVWALRSWTEPANLATTIQFLDVTSVPEDVHFGSIW